ncbi:MAG: hypothetical protein JNK04_17365 [Myxococcales bacterium]|nr:hypothetical protein [Myxococcales bacterium]
MTSMRSTFFVYGPLLASVALLMGAKGNCGDDVNVGDDDCTGEAPECAAPEAGCHYENSGCIDGAWTCGELVCECEGGPPPCAAPPDGCQYENGGCVDGEWTCGELVCECEGGPPPCAAPPLGCDYINGGCIEGQWTCGELVCETFACGDITCLSYEQYCLTTIPGIPNEPLGYSCESTPTECLPEPTCACLDVAGATACDDATTGQVTVTVALP